MYIFNRKRLLTFILIVKKIFLYLQNMNKNINIHSMGKNTYSFIILFIILFFRKNTYSFIILFIILFFSFKENIYFNLENK
ncbi:hypothetical protein PFBG_03579 [Plasmodium falciparum 7G8]|uniref:Uncharacterized protein n=1 Tax=Plasmodium falciparum (isolate 7G8) TaxID=57266 RepID=W7EZL8_PLAF8|nr:hypothetical protein PFBG_03579 [Plasmodium falciparum 7G8]